MHSSLQDILLIFDCDGVLIDSEIISLAIDAEMLTELGLTSTVKDVANTFLGVSAKAANALIEQELGYPIPQGVNARYHSRLEAAFKQNLVAIPGVMEFLGGWFGQKCVASSSSSKRLQNTLTQTGLFAHFDPNIYSAEMVANGKPAPDLFLYAANNMGFLPGNCLVIEDSVNGVLAACAAGMKCLGFAGGSHCGEGYPQRLQEAGAEEVIFRMDELGEWIKRNIKT
jgi:HAD superfamily hydrolase (TIGR01509 family)